ncbi:MAG: M28 family peptidase [Planctomycetaceae bacterium]
MQQVPQSCTVRHTINPYPTNPWRRFGFLALIVLISACSQQPVDSAEGEARLAQGPVAVPTAQPASPPAGVANVRIAVPAKFDPDRAFRYLEEVCRLGPRISGTEGMKKQQEMIDEHFTKLGAKVFYQQFDTSHPETGAPVKLQNMIVSWHPAARDRVLLCCHYDTRPRPDQEPYPPNRDKVFIGANDGASGVALFMELGHILPTLQTEVGVDFVFFDAEELIYDNKRDRDRYFLGSQHFAKEYRDQPPQYRYLAGVLVDMIGDKNLQLYMEQNSMKLAPDVTRSVWAAARQVKARHFISRIKHDVRDDHLALNEIAKIPTCDVIDFDYPYWHTRNDLPSACSGESLQEVGAVLTQWLINRPPR